MDLPVFRPADFLALLETPAARARLLQAGRTAQAAEVTLAQARDIGRRIAADFSLPVARFAEGWLARLFKRLFDGIDVFGLAALPALASTHTLVYLPCHRSHLDYLLLSHVLYRGGLLPPHIAAGDNMNMPLLGHWLRKGGGFFMRRSFKGDALYATVFALYMENLLAHGLALEFFIEGGRSRSGRMLPPKLGLLGMVVGAYASNPVRPVALVPVYIGYEKLPEGRSFLRELAGLPKRRESLWDVLAAGRLLFQQFGRPCLSFGEPLRLAEWLAGLQTAKGDGMRSAMPALGDEMLRRIAAAAPVNAVNLVALALLAEPTACLPRASLEQRIAALKTQTSATVSPLSAAACIDHALRLEMVEAEGADIIAPGEKAALLDYFRQNIVHHFPSAITPAITPAVAPTTQTARPEERKWTNSG